MLGVGLGVNVAFATQSTRRTEHMPKKYIVYIRQVNQTCLEVTADNEEQAREKGRAKWRREWAHAEVVSVEKCDDEFQSSE